MCVCARVCGWERKCLWLFVYISLPNVFNKCKDNKQVVGRLFDWNSNSNVCRKPVTKNGEETNDWWRFKSKRKCRKRNNNSSNDQNRIYLFRLVGFQLTNLFVHSSAFTSISFLFFSFIHDRAFLLSLSAFHLCDSSLFLSASFTRIYFIFLLSFFHFFISVWISFFLSVSSNLH